MEFIFEFWDWLNRTCRKMFDSRILIYEHNITLF